MIFSIIIPAYNEQNYIADCLKSVASLKIPPGQTLEVIVVNNASTDKTVEVARTTFPEAKIVDEPQKGLTRAYNRGAKESRGDVLIFVDADVILPKDHLEKIAREFGKDAKLVALSGPYIYKDGGPFCYLSTIVAYVVLAVPCEIIFNRCLNFAAGIISGNSAMRKKAFEEIGGFNQTLFYGLDTDIALRIKKRGKVRFKPGLSVEQSSRRLKKEGVVRMIVRYAMNLLWPVLFNKPFTKNYIDVR